MRAIGTLDSGLLIEAFVVGIMVVVIGLIVHFLLKKAKPDLIDERCKDWNKNHIMEICLFLTGAFTHIVSEFGGLNQWYVNKYSQNLTSII
jgi:hypothetical protein